MVEGEGQACSMIVTLASTAKKLFFCVFKEKILRKRLVVQACVDEDGGVGCFFCRRSTREHGEDQQSRQERHFEVKVCVKIWLRVKT